jgi:hypothetical protein
VFVVALAGCAGTQGATDAAATRRDLAAVAMQTAGTQADPVPGAPELQIALSGAGRQPATIRLTGDMLRAALRAGALDVDLGNGTRYRVRMTGAKDEPGGRWTAIGKVATRFGPQSMVLTFHGNDVFGVLPKPDGMLLSIQTTRGITSVAPAGGMVPPGKRGAEHPDFLVPPAPPRPRGALAAARAQAAAPQHADPGVLEPVEIDLLGLYGDELVSLRGSADAAETEIINQVAVANQAHVDSGSRVRFSLVGLEQVPVPAGSYNTPMLDAITYNALDGVDIDALRDAAGADLVFLMRPYTEGDSTCGIGWLGSGELGRTNAQDQYGYSVSDVGPGCGSYVFPHELGHNLGSMHDLQNSTDYTGDVSYGAYPYSFGYKQPGPPGFATIMAYEAYGEPWVGYFSSPALTACGAPCGIADKADNVRSLNQMAVAVADFRGPPGTLSIADAEVVEPVAGEQVEATVAVRLNGAAPAGGLQLEVALAGGTATQSSDFEPFPSTAVFIAEGEREATVRLVVLGDDAVEGDETVVLRLGSPAGVVIDDAEAVVVIADDDPRPILSGRLRFPAGVPPPASAWLLQFQGVDGPGDSYRMVTASPPDFAYSVAVAKGSEVTVYANPTDPFVTAPLAIGQMDADAQVDFPVQKGVLVSGHLRLPDGGAVPDGNVAVSIDESTESGGLLSTRNFSLVEGDSYSGYFMPGATINIKTAGAAPYQPYWFRVAAADEDLVQDIELSTLPSLVVWGAEDVTERFHTFVGNDSLSPSFALSAPAPEGGVSISYRTRAGTATAGEDFVASSGTVEIPAGSSGQVVGIEYIDDYRYERDVEYFDIVAESVQGASPTVPAMRVFIHDNDAHTGGPGQKQATTP